MSNIKLNVSNKVIESFNKVKKGDIMYTILEITKDERLIVGKEGTSKTPKDYDKTVLIPMKKDLPPKNARYIILRYDRKISDGVEPYFLFITWMPSKVKFKSKERMLYPSSCNHIKTKIFGNSNIEHIEHIQTGEKSDITEKKIKERLNIFDMTLDDDDF